MNLADKKSESSYFKMSPMGYDVGISAKNKPMGFYRYILSYYVEEAIFTVIVFIIVRVHYISLISLTAE